MRAPTSIDLTAVPLPSAIETIDPAVMRAAFIARFAAAWEEERAKDPTLDAFDIGNLEANPVAIQARAFAYLRTLDRQRVNDVLRAVLATTSTGTNLDALVARQNVQRQTLVAATPTTAAVMEGDASLLNRYLLSFDRGSAGSADRYLFEAWTAWPSGFDSAGNRIGMGDARVNGRAVHGRRGNTDIVVAGPGGRVPTATELALIRRVCTAPHVAPEAVAVEILAAKRSDYSVRLRIEIPPGPDATIVRDDVAARVKAAAMARTTIGGEIPAGFFRGIAYGNPNVITAVDTVTVAADAKASTVAPDPYRIPVMTAAAVEVQVRS